MRAFVVATLILAVALVVYGTPWTLAEVHAAIKTHFGYAVIVAIISAAASTLVAWYALNKSASVNIRNKRMDVILHCNMRYDQLYQLRYEIQKSNSTDLIDSYFRRFWGLQSDQIDYWLAGYVDPETMASWLHSLAASLRDKGIGDGDIHKKYSESWQNIHDSHRIVNERLYETVEFLERCIGQNVLQKDMYPIILQYLRIVEIVERPLIVRLSQNNRDRINVDELATTIVKNEHWQNYNAYDARRLSARGIYLMVARLSRAASHFRAWLFGDQFSRLEQKIKSKSEKSPPTQTG